MKLKQSMKALLNLLVLFLLAGCGVSKGSILTEQKTPVENQQVNYEGISFSYDEALATKLIMEIVPSEPATPISKAIPEHRRFIFSGYPASNQFFKPQILVYPIDEFKDGKQVVADLQQLIEQKSASAEKQIPWLPGVNGIQMIRTHILYIDFQNGTGVRFLTQYGQDIAPINNEELFYTFQGITHDKKYYISAILPVHNSILPLEVKQIEDLSNQPASTFTPNLALLDNVINSLQVR